MTSLSGLRAGDRGGVRREVDDGVRRRGRADVSVVEKNDQLDGRAAVLEGAGCRFDMGPSWYLMPDVFERAFAHLDGSPEE